MDSFLRFMTSPSGRIFRFALGLFLIWLGLYQDAGLTVALIGLIPIFAAIFNFCVLAPLFGRPLFPRSVL